MLFKSEPEKGGFASARRPSRSERLAVAQGIEDNLKRVYQASLVDAIPDRFIQMLEQLRLREDGR
jgi:Anti-sigma factor NepR